jgi:hypothetical protein
MIIYLFSDGFSVYQPYLITLVLIACPIVHDFTLYKWITEYADVYDTV